MGLSLREAASHNRPPNLPKPASIAHAATTQLPIGKGQHKRPHRRLGLSGGGCAARLLGATLAL